jgi:hypothetical protein
MYVLSSHVLFSLPFLFLPPQYGRFMATPASENSAGNRKKKDLEALICQNQF